MDWKGVGNPLCIVSRWIRRGGMKLNATYCTISINSSPLRDCDTPDENFCSSLCPEACDMGKISSGAALCLAISAVLGVEFEAVIHSGNQNWCFYD
jgi:hypothetical protein